MHRSGSCLRVTPGTSKISPRLASCPGSTRGLDRRLTAAVRCGVRTLHSCGFPATRNSSCVCHMVASAPDGVGRQGTGSFISIRVPRADDVGESDGLDFEEQAAIGDGVRGGCEQDAAVAVGSIDHPADRDAEEVGGDRQFPASGSSDRSRSSLGVGRQEVVGEPVARQARGLCQGPGFFEQVRGTLNDHQLARAAQLGLCPVI